MAKPGPVLHEQVFEARYERGYRYLDRCGDVMLILEDLLQKTTGQRWLPRDMKPTGAHIHAPDLDAAVQFDAARATIVQTPCKQGLDFTALTSNVMAAITGRFDLRTFSRIGARRQQILPAQDIDESDKQTVRRLRRLDDWPAPPEADMAPRSRDVTIVYETADRARGIKFSVRSIRKVEAPEQVDERLRMPPHLLPENQRAALLEQLQRRRKLAEDPPAGLMIDCDYYCVWLERWDAEKFLLAAWQEADRLTNSFLESHNENR